MMAATAVIAIQPELVSAALEAASAQLGLSPVFLGAVVLALVGTVSDLFAAVLFARQDKMDIVFTICVGSAIQTALVAAPVLVLVSWLIGQPMNLFSAARSI
jgi:Ca2+:H+ antiporter